MLTEKQKEFCKLFVSGKNATDSYSIAFTIAKQGTSKAASSRLLKTDKIKSYISELQSENKKIVAMANEKAAQDIADGSIADAAERMQMLTKILRGELSIASAGILGVALGLGAQTLVRDVLSGIFMLVEDQYGVGDQVDVLEVQGVVEKVGLRVTSVRDKKGTLWYLRNGEILKVGNQSQSG